MDNAQATRITKELEQVNRSFKTMNRTLEQLTVTMFELAKLLKETQDAKE